MKAGITFLIEESTKDEIIKLAKIEGRSMGNFIAYLLELSLEKYRQPDRP